MAHSKLMQFFCIKTYSLAFLVRLWMEHSINDNAPFASCSTITFVDI